MARGGARPGSGRPRGKSFRDYVSDRERKKFIEFILDTYMGDMRLAVWLGNQLFGQAPQSIDHTTNGKELPTPILNVLEDNSDKANLETVEED